MDVEQAEKQAQLFGSDPDVVRLQQLRAALSPSVKICSHAHSLILSQCCSLAVFSQCCSLTVCLLVLLFRCVALGAPLQRLQQQYNCYSNYSKCYSSTNALFQHNCYSTNQCHHRSLCIEPVFCLLHRAVCCVPNRAERYWVVLGDALCCAVCRIVLGGASCCVLHSDERCWVVHGAVFSIVMSGAGWCSTSRKPLVDTTGLSR